MPADEAAPFLTIYKSFSSAQIRSLQFAFRVILKDAGSAGPPSSARPSHGYSEGRLPIDQVKSFFIECEIDGGALADVWGEAMALPEGARALDLHEFIETVYHLRERDDGEKNIVPRILAQSRSVQDARTFVPFDRPIASNRQMQQARREAQLSQAKAKALASMSMHGLEPYYPTIFQSFAIYWNGNYGGAAAGADTIGAAKSTADTTNTGVSAPNVSAPKLHRDDEPILSEADAINALSSAFWRADIAHENLTTLVSLVVENRKAEREACAKYADTFSADMLRKFVQQFRAMDDDHSGCVSTAEIGGAFRNSGIDVDEETLAQIVLEADEDESGEVDVSEWLGMMKAVRDGTSKSARILAEVARKNEEAKEQQRLRAQMRRRDSSAHRAAVLKRFPPHRLAAFRSTFESFDADASGAVDFEELQAMCKAMDMAVPAKELRKLMQEVDTSGDNEVDFVEFVEMMDNGRKQGGALANIFYDMAARHDRMAAERRHELIRKREKELRSKEAERNKRLKKAAMRAEAMKRLTAKEKTAAQKSFELIDVDNSGALDEEELHAAFKALGLKLKEREVRRIFKKVDIDGDGTLDLDEFLITCAECKNDPKHASALRKLGNATNSVDAREALYEKKQKAKLEQLKKQEAAAAKAAMRAETRKKFTSAQLRKLKSQFDLIDVDKGGDLDETEIFDMFRAMGIKIGKKEGVPKREIRKLIKEIDEDESGTVDFDEFLVLFQKIMDARKGFLFQARQRAEAASKKSVGGTILAVDLSAMESLANERKAERVARREERNRKAEAQAELLKIFSKRELEELRALFTRLDRDRSGRLERDELRAGLLGDEGGEDEGGADDPKEDEPGEVRGEGGRDDGGKDAPASEEKLSPLQLRRQELDAALEEIDDDGDGSIDWFEFLRMMKSIQEGKGTSGGRLIYSLAEKNLHAATRRREQRDQERVLAQRKILQKSLKRGKQAEKNKEDLEAQKSKEREAKAARRKGRADAARKKREQRDQMMGTS